MSALQQQSDLRSSGVYFYVKKYLVSPSQQLFLDNFGVLASASGAYEWREQRICTVPVSGSNLQQPLLIFSRKLHVQEMKSRSRSRIDEVDGVGYRVAGMVLTVRPATVKIYKRHRRIYPVCIRLSYQQLSQGVTQQRVALLSNKTIAYLVCTCAHAAFRSLRVVRLKFYKID